MKKWTISKRVAAGFAAVVIITAALGVFALYKIRQIQAGTDTITSETMPSLKVLAAVTHVQTENRLLVYKHIMSADLADMTAIEKEITDNRAKVSSALDAFQKMFVSEEEKTVFERLMGARKEFVAEMESLIQKSRAAQDSAAREAVYKQARLTFLPISMNLMEILAALEKIENDAAEVTKAQMQSTVSAAEKGIAMGILISVLGATALAVVIIRGTGRVLRSVSETLDLGAGQVASAASQVSSSSQTLAEGASEQAASLEETSAALEEISSMTKRNAESSQQAKTLSAETRASAEAGASDMKSMRTAMNAIKSSSDEIAKIIKTIDEIAFQTNILALNAAVEAARAGEAGMGFAVVADEVRSLAQRSAQSAKETAAKIEDAITKSEQGVDISSKVASALDDILAKVLKMDGLVAEIATASQEQSQGIGQVNAGVSEMDKVTQSNAATAEESAGASEELSQQANSMQVAVEELRGLVGASAHSKAPSKAGVVTPVLPAKVRKESGGIRLNPAVKVTQKKPVARLTKGVNVTNGVHIGAGDDLSADFKDF